MSGYTSEPHCFKIVLKLVLLFVSVQTGNGADDNVYYMVSASGSIFSGRPYGVVVGIFNSLVSSSCEVFLNGPSLDMSMQMYLTPNDPISSYVFEIPELKSGDYFLKVKGVRGLQFENTTKLNWHNYKNFIKIQTPKTHYRPGQLLQFRIFFHNETMNEVYPEYKAYIWIEDAKGNRVKVYKAFDVTKGVFQSELRLSQTLNTGRWRICAQNGPDVLEECAYIQVMNFEFSPFYVELSAPSEINISDKQLLITVKASYSIDTPVEGRLNIQIKTFVEAAVVHKPLIVTFKKVLTDGQANFNVSLQPFQKKMIPNMPLRLRLVANVFEKLTDKMITANRLVTLWGEHVVTEDSSDHATISYRARKPIKNVISINYGTVRMIEKITFRLNHKISQGICVIMFNGLILTGKQVFPDASKTFNIDVKLTMKMWPFVQVFLFGMEDNSTVLLVAAQTITVPRFGHVHTELKVPPVVRPGELITLGIKAVPHTYVCLAGVDIRAFDLHDWPNNDFTLDYFNVAKFALRAYVSDTKTPQASTPRKMGMIIMSNTATVEDADANPSDNQTLNKITLRSRKLNDPSATDSTNKVSNIEDNIDDVWIYECLLVTKSGWTNLTKRVPNTMTSWRLSSFSVDPSVGLTLQAHESFLKIRSIKPVLMFIKLPKTIKVGEIVKLALKCYKQLDKDLDVTIKIKQNLHQFELLDENEKPYTEPNYFVQKVNLNKGGLNLDNIYLRAVKSGNLILNFMTITENVKDRMVREIEVLPDVPMVLHQKATFVTLNSLKPYLEFQMDLPHQQALHGLSCLVSGNIIAPMLQSISVIESKDNCEQLISKLMSIYYLWDYGYDKKWLTPQWKQFLEGQLNDGFQSIMRLRGRDGGFNYIAKTGNHSDSGCSSTWLTAYALRLFQLLEKVPIQFDDRLQVQCEKFLLSRRESENQFTEPCATPGRRKLQPVELSIEVFKVLQQSKRMLNLQTSYRWLKKQFQTSHDFHIEAKRNLNIMKWKQPEETGKINQLEQQRYLETAGHTLLLHLQRKYTTQQADIAHWLIGKMYGENSNLHCFECSVAQRAIFEYLKAQSTEPTELEVVSWLDSAEKEQRLTINKKNQMDVQLLAFNSYNQKINFKAEGTGELLVRCSYNYEVNSTDRLYKMSVNKLADKMLNKQLRKIEFCVERNSKNLGNYVGTEVELKLPTGYQLGMESVQRVMESKFVSQATPLSKNTKLFLTLVNLVPNKSLCVNVVAKTFHRIKNLQNGTLSVSDINSLEQIEVLPYSTLV